MGAEKIGVVIIITKAKLFPSSNSTLYYEQGLEQIKALSDNKIFAMAIRLVGLFSPIGIESDAVWTDYHSPRYSRTVVVRENTRVRIERRRGPNGRYNIHRVD